MDVIGESKKFAAENSEKLKEFQERVAGLQDAHRAATISAEAKFTEWLDELHLPKYPNTNYWDKYGPMLNGKIRAWHYEDCEKRLNEVLSQIDSEFLLRIEEVEREYFG
jgi:hypothetical protein